MSQGGIFSYHSPFCFSLLLLGECAGCGWDEMYCQGGAGVSVSGPWQKERPRRVRIHHYCLPHHHHHHHHHHHRRHHDSGRPVRADRPRWATPPRREVSNRRANIIIPRGALAIPNLFPLSDVDRHDRHVQKAAAVNVIIVVTIIVRNSATTVTPTGRRRRCARPHHCGRKTAWPSARARHQCLGSRPPCARAGTTGTPHTILSHPSSWSVVTVCQRRRYVLLTHLLVRLDTSEDRHLCSSS
jgi:hypothetical protein